MRQVHAAPGLKTRPTNTRSTHATMTPKFTVRHGKNTAREGMGSPHGADAAHGPDPAVHRVASGARGHEPAGIRCASRSRVERSVPSAYVRDRRSHRADARAETAVSRRHGRGHDGRARTELSRVRSAPVEPRRRTA